jgi:hypothetical protein
MLRRGQTDDGGVDIIPLHGGIILHVLHALLPLVLGVSQFVMCLRS